ncbi:MAG: glycosyltransferase [Frankiales bacterium]|nr:glycosyltransferase [Frankiales bacterium]
MRIVADPAWRNRKGNPYNALLYDALVRRGVEVLELVDGPRTTDVAALHVHWPDSPWGRRVLPQAYASAWADARRRRAFSRAGVPVVWTAHNAWAHGGKYVRSERLWWRRWGGEIDGWIALSEAARDVIVREHPQLAARPHTVIPHGHYRDAYPCTETRAQARSRLGLREDSRVVGFVGRVKPYKGVPELLRAFNGLQGDDLQLLVTGRCDDPATGREVQALAAQDHRVVVRLTEVPEGEMAGTVGCLDVAVLPYRAVLNSGTALLALSFDTPVLLPSGPTARELDQLAPNWVFTFENPLTPDDLREALERVPEGSPDLESVAWDRIAADHEAFYETLRASS